jgi:hypothetical protein
MSATTIDIPTLLKKIDHDKLREWLPLLEQILPHEKKLPRADRKVLLEAAYISLKKITKKIDQKEMSGVDKPFLTFLLLFARVWIFFSFLLWGRKY